jgi:hypothetical protein
MYDQAIGKKVIIRTFSAGVHYGTLAICQGKEVKLHDARRIWMWQGAFTLSELSLNGLSSGSKLSAVIPAVYLTEAIEIIPCSEKAISVLDTFPAYQP